MSRRIGYAVFAIILLLTLRYLTRRSSKTEKFEEDTTTVIQNLKSTIDDILSRPPADEPGQVYDDDDDEDEDEVMRGSA